MSDITNLELDVLEMLAGKRPAKWGAWVSACLEFLSANGYATRGPKYQITPAGEEILRAHRP